MHLRLFEYLARPFASQRAFLHSPRVFAHPSNAVLNVFARVRSVLLIHCLVGLLNEPKQMGLAPFSMGQCILIKGRVVFVQRSVGGAP